MRYTEIMGKESTGKVRRHEVHWILERETHDKSFREPVAACARYVECVALAKPWHDKGPFHQRISRVSLPLVP